MWRDSDQQMVRSNCSTLSGAYLSQSYLEAKFLEESIFYTRTLKTKVNILGFFVGGQATTIFISNLKLVGEILTLVLFLGKE